MEESQRFKALLDEHAKFLDELKAVHERIQQLIELIKEACGQERMCMHSHCCRDSTKSSLKH